MLSFDKLRTNGKGEHCLDGAVSALSSPVSVLPDPFMLNVQPICANCLTGLCHIPHPFVLSLSKHNTPNPRNPPHQRMQAAYDLAQARMREREIVVDRVAA